MNILKKIMLTTALSLTLHSNYTMFGIIKYLTTQHSGGQEINPQTKLIYQPQEDEQPREEREKVESKLEALAISRKQNFEAIWTEFYRRKMEAELLKF